MSSWRPRPRAECPAGGRGHERNVQLAARGVATNPGPSDDPRRGRRGKRADRGGRTTPAAQVKLHAFFDEPTMFYLVMDLIEGGELFERIAEKEFYSEKEARDLILILLQTIKYCHDTGVVHRDLKPENLLCVSRDDDSNIKLCDFGFAARGPSGEDGAYWPRPCPTLQKDGTSIHTLQKYAETAFVSPNERSNARRPS